MCALHLKNRWGLITQLCRSPDGKKLAGTYWRGDISVWDTSTGEVMCTLSDHKGNVRSINWSPNGENIVSGGLDQIIRVWNWKTGKMTHQLSGNLSEIRYVIYSPDGKFIASCGDEPNIRIWDANTGELLRNISTGFQDPVYWVYCLAFSPDGETIVSGDIYGVCTVWNYKTGQRVSTLQAGRENITSLSYSPCGGAILISSTDSMVRIWDLDMHTCQELKGHDGPVRSATYSTHGDYIMSIEWEYTVKFWRENIRECIKTDQFARIVNPVGNSTQFFLYEKSDGTNVFVYDPPLLCVDAILSWYLERKGKLSDPRIWEAIRDFV